MRQLAHTEHTHCTHKLEQGYRVLLKDRLTHRRIILASNSPRRKSLMEDCGMDFVMGETIEVDERYPEDMAVNEIPLYLAKLKSTSYPSALEPNDILITADTLVVMNNMVLGKPRDRREAMEMLSTMSGQMHTVITAVVVRSREKVDSFSVKTDVWFRKLRHQEIEYYVDNFNPYDKAGGYGIQDWIGYVGIERIEGSFYNVMGLPIQSLYASLEEF